MACGIEALEQDGSSIKIFPTHIDIDIWSELSDAFDGSLKIVMGSKTYINLALRKAPKPLELVNKIFEKYIQIANENK